VKQPKEPTSEPYSRTCCCREGIPAAWQRLILEGRPLEDARDLAGYLIDDDSVLHLPPFRLVKNI
jgi:hypothetical protein